MEALNPPVLSNRLFRRRRGKNFKSGFSLLEMILVLAILSFGFFPLIGLFSNGILASSDITKTTIALQLARQKMEQTKSLPYSSIANTSEALLTINNFPQFSRAVSTEAPSVNLKKVTVIVYWGQGAGSNSFALQTYIANF